MRRSTSVGAASVLGLLVASWVAVRTGQPKLLGIGWVAFVGMLGGAALGGRRPGRDATALVWGYGLASGAMVVSAALFLLPQALSVGGRFGGFGVAVGLLSGFGAHTLGHRLSHLEFPGNRTVVELTAHAVAAGVIIGVVYGNMPELGPLLGVAIVSHKGPAGYAAASRLRRGGRSSASSVEAMALPAAGVGIAAVAASAATLPPGPAFQGIVFGFAAGVFLHVAMDFLPRCEIGSEVHEALGTEGDAHALLDRLRTRAVASTAAGGAAVFAAWLTVGG